MIRCIFILLWLLFVCTKSSPYAQAQISDPQSLVKIEAERQKARKKAAQLDADRKRVLGEISQLQSTLVLSAAEAVTVEKQARTLSAEIETITAKRGAVLDQIFKDRKSLSTLLGLLQNLKAPLPTVLSSGNSNRKKTQTAQLMAGLSNRINQRIDTLSADIAILDQLETTKKSKQKSLENSEKNLAKKQSKIKETVARKTTLEKNIYANQQKEKDRIAKLSADAKSLRELIIKLERSARLIEPRVKPDTAHTNNSLSNRPRLKPKPKLAPEPLQLPPDTRRFADARGRLRPPVTGQLRKSFGKGHEGMIVSSRPASQVIAPYSGRIEFSGPFKNYNNVIILNVGDGYFILMTGLGDIYAQTGQNVVSGEPIGLMPRTPKKTELYIEFRKNGAPINPTPWLGTSFASSG